MLYPFLSLNPNFNIIGPFNGVEIASVYILLFLVWNLSKYVKSKYIFNRGSIWIFIVYSIVIFFINTYQQKVPIKSGSELILKTFLTFFLYFHFALNIHSQKFRISLIRVSWIVTLLLGIISLLVYLGGEYHIDVTRGVTRYSGLYNDPGLPAFYALFSIMFGALLKETIKPDLWQRIFYLITWVVSLLIFAITVTKSVLILFFIYIIAWFGFYKRYYFILSLGIIFGLYFLISTDNPISQRFSEEAEYITGEDDKIERLGTGRVGRWIRLIDMYKYEYTIGEQLFGTFNIYSAHNNYLAILLQLGLTGLFIFLILYIRFFSKLLKVYRQIRTAEVYIGIILSVQIFVYAMSGHPFYYTNILWYLMLFFALNNLVYSHRTNYLSNNDYA
jgi:hypothetical protein